MDDFELIFLRGAESDLIEIYSRYLDRSSDAADRFYDFTDSRLDLLQISPELAPVYESPYRRLVLGRYPYGVFYSIERRRIVIAAILDLRQDPVQIRRRLGLN